MTRRLGGVGASGSKADYEAVRLTVDVSERLGRGPKWQDVSLASLLTKESPSLSWKSKSE